MLPQHNKKVKTYTISRLHGTVHQKKTFAATCNFTGSKS